MLLLDYNIVLGIELGVDLRKYRVLKYLVPIVLNTNLLSNLLHNY